MKYMGSKRSMLLNGLGTLLSKELTGAKRFIDLFTGSSAVASFVATNYSIEVQAFDLQDYGVALANAVIARTEMLDGETIWASWKKAAEELVLASRPPNHNKLTQKRVRELRKWCANPKALAFTRAYGGHYFSPIQAIWFDALRTTLPRDPIRRAVALAALIETASKCAAAPGHTAQPFQPTRSAKPFLQEAWDRDVPSRTKYALLSLTALCAKKAGVAEVKDANDAARNLKKGDLVFVDPPYSGVHYSRFYHVLETIARGRCGEVSGVGRYPAPEKRPRSKYSVGSESLDALDDLLETLASRETKVILTFPDHDCSNGLSGKKVKQIASQYFSVTEKKVRSRFSTLGGNGSGDPGTEGRAARHNAHELILLLRSR